MYDLDRIKPLNSTSLDLSTLSDSIRTIINKTNELTETFNITQRNVQDLQKDVVYSAVLKQVCLDLDDDEVMQMDLEQKRQHVADLLLNNIFKPNDPYIKWPVKPEEVSKRAEGLAFFLKMLGELKNENRNMKSQLNNVSGELFKMKQEVESKVSFDTLYVKLRQWEDAHNQKFSANMDLIDERIADFKSQLTNNFQNDFADFRRMHVEMEARIREMETMYASKINKNEFNSRINELAFKNEESFREYYTYLKNNYDKAMQKVSNSQVDFERIVEQKLGDVSNLSLSFDSKLEEMNRLLLSAGVIEEVLNKSRKIENLTFAMQDMLKDCQGIKEQIIAEHESYVEHVGHMSHKVSEFETRLEGFNSRADRIDELFYLRNDIQNYVRKDDFALLASQLGAVEAQLYDSTTTNNEKMNKANKSLMAYVENKLGNIPNKAFIVDYLTETAETVKRDLDARSEACIEKLSKSNQLQPLVMKHDDQIKRLLSKFDDMENEEDPVLTASKIHNFCLSCGHESKIKSKYSPRKQIDSYKNTRPNSGFRTSNTNYTESSNLMVNEETASSSFYTSKNRSHVKRKNESVQLQVQQLKPQAQEDSMITLDYLESNDLKTVDMATAILNDKILIDKDKHFDKIVNKRPASARNQPVSKRILKHCATSLNKEDFYNNIKNSNLKVLNHFRKN